MISKRFVYHKINGDKVEIELKWDVLAVIGFSGRDEELVRKHVDELAQVGIALPKETPSVYWIDPSRVSQSNILYVVGNKTSGEVELFCAFDDKDDMYITVGSDHTDRELEKVDIHKSKQICNKIVGVTCWKFDDISNHVDELEIKCYFRKKAEAELILYQHGKLDFIKPLHELKSLLKKNGLNKFGLKFSFFSGTVPFVDGPSSGVEYVVSLYDPLLKREIKAKYRVINLKKD